MTTPQNADYAVRNLSVSQIATAHKLVAGILEGKTMTVADLVADIVDTNDLTAQAVTAGTVAADIITANVLSSPIVSSTFTWNNTAMSTTNDGMVGILTSSGTVNANQVSVLTVTNANVFVDDIVLLTCVVQAASTSAIPPQLSIRTLQNGSFGINVATAASNSATAFSIYFWIIRNA